MDQVERIKEDSHLFRKHKGKSWDELIEKFLVPTKGLYAALDHLSSFFLRIALKITEPLK
jgi:hypothetical protein